MIVPKKIKIAGIWYDIKFVAGLRADDDCSGKSLLTKAKILLDNDMCADMNNATCLHEVFEIIKEENQLKISHRALQTMATQFYQVIVDNPELFSCA